MTAYLSRNEAVKAQAAAYDARALSGDNEATYRFDYQVCDENSVHFSENSMRIDGFDQAIDLDVKSPFAGLLDD
jgi:acetoacetyl-[acyl-carrier protein] synthase